MNAVDLHVHSTCSDGTYTPAGLVDYAIQKGLCAFALTDHDTIDGLSSAISYAESLRSTLPNAALLNDAPANDTAPFVPEVIPGIELSTDYEGQDVHIVGLYIRYQDSVFLAKLREFQDSRLQRNRRMCLKLAEAGIDISYEALLQECPDAVITRAHYARYLLNHGYTKSMKEAFDRYVGNHAPCYVPREKVTPQQAVQLILDAGGFPVLAHPMLYPMGRDRLETLVSQLKEAGLMGIEAVYSTYKPYEERHVRMLAQKYRLLISGGSDFHGDNKPGLDLGTGYGKLFVPVQILEDIRSALGQT